MYCNIYIYMYKCVMYTSYICICIEPCMWEKQMMVSTYIIYLKIKRYTQVRNVLIWMIYIYIYWYWYRKETCVYMSIFILQLKLIDVDLFHPWILYISTKWDWSKGWTFQGTSQTLGFLRLWGHGHCPRFHVQLGVRCHWRHLLHFFLQVRFAYV